MQFIAYLSFEDNAREAMDFYAAAFGGTVTQRVTYGESPMCREMELPEPWPKKKPVAWIIAISGSATPTAPVAALEPSLPTK